jgi:hypothetical protein
MLQQEEIVLEPTEVRALLSELHDPFHVHPVDLNSGGSFDGLRGCPSVLLGVQDGQKFPR